MNYSVNNAVYEGETVTKVDISGADIVYAQELRIYNSAGTHLYTEHVDQTIYSKVITFTMYVDFWNDIVRFHSGKSGAFKVEHWQYDRVAIPWELTWRKVAETTINYTLNANKWTRPAVDMTITATPLSASGYVMKGTSCVQAAFSGDCKMGATVSSYTLTVEGKNYGSPYKSDPLTTGGRITVKGTITDTRGFTGSVTKEIIALDNMPSLNSFTGGNLNEGLKYNFTPPNNVYTSKVLLEANPGTGYVTVQEESLGTASGAQPKDLVIKDLGKLYEMFPSSANVPLRLTLRTYTEIGSKMAEEYSKELVAKIPDNEDTKPTISAITIKGNPVQLNDNSLVIKTKNGANVAITCAGRYKASASAVWKMKSATYANGATSPTMQEAGNIPITIEVTDSRGFVRTASATVAVKDYWEPRVSPVEEVVKVARAKRVEKEDGSTEWVQADDGEYLYIEAAKDYASLNGKNKCTLGYKLRVSGEDFPENPTILLDGNSASNQYVGYRTSNGDYVNKQGLYYLELSVTDSFGATGTLIKPIAPERAFMDRSGSKNSIAFGGHVTEANAFQVFWAARFYHGVVIEPLEEGAALVLTSNGGKRFIVTVDDNGTLSTMEAPQTFLLRGDNE